MNKLPTINPYKAKQGQEYYCKPCGMTPKQGYMRWCLKGTWCVCPCGQCVKDYITFKVGAYL